MYIIIKIKVNLPLGKVTFAYFFFLAIMFKLFIWLFLFILFLFSFSFCSRKPFSHVALTVPGEGYFSNQVLRIKLDIYVFICYSSFFLWLIYKYIKSNNLTRLFMFCLFEHETNYFYLSIFWNYWHITGVMVFKATFNNRGIHM